MLKEYKRNFLWGRVLDAQSEETVCDSRTTEISVSRQNLYSDAMEKLLTDLPINDYSYLLEVKGSLSIDDE